MLAGAFYGLEELPRPWLRKLDRQVKTEIEASSSKLIRLSPWMQQRINAVKEEEMDTFGEKIAIAEVAVALKTTTINVMMHIKRGLLVGEEIEGLWYVPADSLSSYLSTTDGIARGSLCHSSCGHGCSSCQ